MTDQRPAAILASTAPLRTRQSRYPAELQARLGGRERRPLGEVFGLHNFGVNHTRLPPGAASALRHAHSRQDEFVYVLEGHPTLVTDAGETPLAPGMCAGFPAGTGEAHHLVNRTGEDVVLLEIGDRTRGDRVDYPGEDLMVRPDAAGNGRMLRRDGSPV